MSAVQSHCSPAAAWKAATACDVPAPNATVQGIEALISGEIGVRSLQEYAADLNEARRSVPSKESR